MDRGTLSVALVLSLWIAGCGGGGDEPLCTPGASVACVGTGGCSGGQVCNAEGTGFGPCSCGPGLDGGPSDGGTSDGGTSDGGTSDSGADDSGTSDSGADDAAVGPCDLVEQTGCGAAQRCTWVEDGLGGGAAACRADGTVAHLGACVGPDAEGVDDCVAGHACIGGLCQEICSTNEGCGADFQCNRFVGFVNDDTTGICVPRCDPVSQTRLHDDAPACGSPEPGAPTLGCYGALGGPYTCRSLSPGAATQTYGSAPIGPPGGGAFASGCATGFTPLGATNGFFFHLFCTPVASSMGNGAQRQGAAPHTCSARGATASTVECRFISFLAANPSLAAPGVGVCVDTAVQTYDHDANPQTSELPWPSCSTLTSPNLVGWGCAPYAP